MKVPLKAILHGMKLKVKWLTANKFKVESSGLSKTISDFTNRFRHCKL